jgi:hypothetical protein
MRGKKCVLLDMKLEVWLASVWYWRYRRPLDLNRSWIEAVSPDEDDIWSDVDLEGKERGGCEVDRGELEKRGL